MVAAPAPPLVLVVGLVLLLLAPAAVMAQQGPFVIPLPAKYLGILEALLMGRDVISVGRTVLSFSDGTPALVLGRHGTGKVALLTTSLDDDWTDEVSE